MLLATALNIPPHTVKSSECFSQQWQTKLDKIRLNSFPADQPSHMAVKYAASGCFMRFFLSIPWGYYTYIHCTSAPPLRPQQLVRSPLLVPSIQLQQTQWIKRRSSAHHGSHCLSGYFSFKDAAVQHLLNKIQPVSFGLEQLRLLTFLSSVEMISTRLTFCLGQANIFERFPTCFGTLYHSLSSRSWWCFSGFKRCKSTCGTFFFFFLDHSNVTWLIVLKWQWGLVVSEIRWI